MATWVELQQIVEAQMDRDPQRATLSKRAIASVEEGLRHLAGVGFAFEIAPRGTLRELVNMKSNDSDSEWIGNDLSIATTQKILASPKDPVNREFEALTGQESPHA